MAGTSSVDFHLGRDRQADPSNSKMCSGSAPCESTKMHRRSACNPALESSRQRRHGELLQASIEVLHAEILMAAKTPGGLVLRLGFKLDLQRINRFAEILNYRMARLC
jgi:hypothetical protein